MAKLARWIDDGAIVVVYRMEGFIQVWERRHIEGCGPYTSMENYSDNEIVSMTDEEVILEVVRRREEMKEWLKLVS